MNYVLANQEHLSQVCDQADVLDGIEPLTEKIRVLMPDLDFRYVLSRGNWYRLGGIVDRSYQSVSDNIVHWAETESGGDVDELVAHYLDSGYFATKLSGKTHYFTAPIGDNPEDFIQLEIEELQEVLDRPLFDRDWFPDSLEEFLDPLDFPRLEPEPVGKSYYRFRRMTFIDQLVDNALYAGSTQFDLKHFFKDWIRSSASSGQLFCRHWVMALRDYVSTDGEQKINARPISTFAEELPELPAGEQLQGADLANAIHDYDRKLGYPFAWYFIMLSTQSSNYALANAVLRDQIEAYDYLPVRDLNVLEAWSERPYRV